MSNEENINLANEKIFVDLDLMKKRKERVKMNKLKVEQCCSVFFDRILKVQ